MKNVLFKIFLFFVVIIGFNACFVVKHVESGNSFSGYIYDNKKEQINVKYRVDFDSLDVIRFRIYSISGLKYIDFIIKPDTFIIKYILDNSYRDMLYRNYYKLNQEVCIYYVFYDLFKGKLFSVSENRICYNRTFIENDCINISSIIYSLILQIKGSQFTTIENFRIPAFVKINFRNNDYILTIVK